MQPQIDLGFVENFNGANTLLFLSEREALLPLSDLLRSLAKRPGHPIALHKQPLFRAHGISLVAEVQDVDRGIEQTGNHFSWVRSPSGWLACSQLAISLFDANAAHHYLDGPQDQATVMISVGEYSRALWNEGA